MSGRSALAEVAAAAPVLAALDPAERGRGLRALAGAVEAAAEELLGLAAVETGLGADRLRGELARTAAQLRLFADVVAEDDWLGLRVDEARPGPPPSPRIVRFRVPMGPALVYEASNFPFAFGVLGTDTAAALAAGCPVLLKTHPGHPETSRRTMEIAAEVLAGLGWPGGVLRALHGEQEVVAAMADPRIRVATFTGSLAAGRALHDLAARRADPLPFYAEMGSINPVFVLPGAARARGREIAEGLVASFAQSAGQLCTKPGLVFLPRGGIEAAVAEAVRDVPAATMLTARIGEGHAAAREALISLDSTEQLAAGLTGAADEAQAVVLAVELDALEELHLEECFGPTVVLVRYDDPADLVEAARRLPGSLTATVHVEADEAPPNDLVRLLVERVGRLVWNGWPTGVLVGSAMHHGGPFPATTYAQFTSVGATAVDRFLRPVAYQGVPDAALPGHVRAALGRDGERVDAI